MKSFELNHEQAEKYYEIMQQRRWNATIGAMGGLGMCYWTKNIQLEAQKVSRLFKKPWMKLPWNLFVFTCGYAFVSQFSAKIFNQPTYMTRTQYRDKVMGEIDLVSKFRYFENETGERTYNIERENIVDYLETAIPLSKNELIDSVVTKMAQNPEFGKKYKVKRRGKDEDDIYWMFSKIHGLENIAFVDPEALLASNGNPVTIQKLVNEAKPPTSADSHEQIVIRTEQALAKYKAVIESMDMKSSDKKKLLALPFFLQKRGQASEPKRGQWQHSIFKELTGHNWDDFDELQVDQEEKITEFDYQNYIKSELLKNKDTRSEDFKEFIRSVNFYQKTEYEQHKKNQDEFKLLMPLFSSLTEEEGRILMHKIKNMPEEDRFIAEITGKKLEKELSKISEEENFNAKNSYRLQRNQLDYADKSRMALDKVTVKDLLRNQEEFRNKIEDTVPTYEGRRNYTPFNNAVLSMVSEAAYGEMADLMKDIGVARHTLPFQRQEEFMKNRDEKMTKASDHNLLYLFNSLFTPLDMTDYEDIFVGEAELSEQIPMDNKRRAFQRDPDPFPMTMKPVGIQEVEQRVLSRTTSLHELMTFEEEEDEDDEEEEGGDEEEEADEEEGDEEEEEVPETINEKYDLEDTIRDPTYFKHQENMRERFNQYEIESFMKMLDIKPFKNWKDESVYHWRMGGHSYEDESQEMDPYYHLLGEVERQHMDKVLTQQFRDGSAVRFEFGDKRPARTNYRF